MSPSRGTVAGAVFNDLRGMAREQGRLSQELFELHALDGFLARLAVSESREHLVLKGGVLLATFDLRRPTRDVDLQAQGLSNDAEMVLALVRQIAVLPSDDGLAFDPASARARVIRDEDVYSGVRVSITAHLASARISFHVDVSVGDPISPGPEQVVLPRILGAPVVLRGYPMAMVHAEKIVTAVSRGTANTRWRDFGDVYAMAGRHAIDGEELIASIDAVAGHRAVDLRPLGQVLAGYGELGQTRYRTWRTKQHRGDLPERFQHLLDRTVAFADPALDRSAAARRWDPVTLAWSEPRP